MYDDGDVVAVDKPCGVPCQAVDPERPDDLPTRLARHLARRHGVDDAYVGTHQRLDRATSGVIVYARRREANAGLAAQLEGREVRKEYVAGVTGGRVPEVLRHRLARGGDGRAEVVGARDRRGRDAVTRVLDVERRGGRALLRLAIETGRTHQIRAQLAHVGAPVAGDVLYGGAPAGRLMLHASALELAHPCTGEPLRLEAPRPIDLDAWLAGAPPRLDDAPTLRRRVEDAMQARWGLGRAALGRPATTAFRLIHGAGDGAPGLHVDVYGDHLVAHLDDDAPPEVARVVVEELARLGFAGVYLKRHPRQPGRLTPELAAALAPPRASAGDDAPDEIVVLEHGVPYGARLGDGLATGLFLDQRENRRRVGEMARDASVLNLFAYTCGFTVAAVAGGARRTVSVDASRAALRRGQQNVARVGGGGDHAFERADVFEALARMPAQSFDLVVSDPPTFSTTSATRWTSGDGHRRLAAECLRVLRPGGRLLACSNDARLSWQRLRRHLHDGARDAGRTVDQMKNLLPPEDFPAGPAEAPHPKAVLLTVSARRARSGRRR